LVTSAENGAVMKGFVSAGLARIWRGTHLPLVPDRPISSANSLLGHDLSSAISRRSIPTNVHVH
jgi:hypothetical protein